MEGNGDASITKVSLSIDSLFRQNYDNTNASNFVFVLPAPIQNVLSMKITAIEIPNFWYVFSSANRSNECIITVYNYKIKIGNNTITHVPSTSYPIVFPEGNYVHVDFVNIMTAYFTNIGGGLNYIVVEIDVNTGKTIFRARHKIDSTLLPSPFDTSTPYYSPDFYYTLDFRLQDEVERPLYKNMGWTLGYTKEFYLVTSQNSFSTLFIPNTLATPNHIVEFKAYCRSESTYGNSLFNYIFLDIDDYNKSFSSDEIISCLPNEYLEGNNIIARIMVNSTSNYINFTTASDAIIKTRKYFGPVTISAMNIRLLDKFGDILQLNGNDFSLLIEFTTSVV
jgi:hypothetical protein